jgi:cell division protein FtsL
MGKPAIFVLFCCAAAMLGGVLLYLWPQMRLVDLGYREGVLQGQRVEAMQHQEELRLEIISLRQLSRIEKFATQRLGLQAPQSTQIIYVRSQHNARRDLQTLTREP